MFLRLEVGATKSISKLVSVCAKEITKAQIPPWPHRWGGSWQCRLFSPFVTLWRHCGLMVCFPGQSISPAWRNTISHIAACWLTRPGWWHWSHDTLVTSGPACHARLLPRMWLNTLRIQYRHLSHPPLSSVGQISCKRKGRISFMGRDRANPQSAFRWMPSNNIGVTAVKGKISLQKSKGETSVRKCQVNLLPKSHKTIHLPF